MAVLDRNAKSTSKAYLRWMEWFADYCESLGVELRDTTAAEVALFLQGMADKGMSASSLIQANVAISWSAQMADRQDPTKKKIV